jgi:nicotinamidase-related amidase
MKPGQLSGHLGTSLDEGLAQRSFPDDADIVAPLRPLGIAFLIVGGAATHQCVEMTVRGASDFGYKVIMVEDGTATVSEELQRNCVIALGDWFCKVQTTEEILTGILNVKSERV